VVETSFEKTLIAVWRQVLVENADLVELGTGRYPVRRTPKQGLRQVDFVFDGNEIRGLEQNPKTKSRWAELARSGRKVMQFLIEGRYVANVTDGKTRPRLPYNSRRILRRSRRENQGSSPNRHREAKPLTNARLRGRFQ
jgi:hypothetical protein